MTTHTPGGGLTRLYPPPCAEWPLAGLYLSHELHKAGGGRPCVYASFLSSLDGRIAVTGADGHSATPPELASAADWRLLQELHAQADCIITHGGYLRALAAGRLGNLLQVRDPDLMAWRVQQGLKTQPDVLVASASLDFSLPDSLAEHGQQVWIATGAATDARGLDVVRLGAERAVEGGPLYDWLAAQGYRSAYLLTGPQMLATLLAAGRLARLYLTQAHQLSGGAQFYTLLESALPTGAGRLRLRKLYLHAGADAGPGQFFMEFEAGGDLAGGAVVHADCSL